MPCSIVVTLEIEKEGLLQLQCLKKQIALWAVEFNKTAFIPLRELRLPQALATHFQ